MAVEGVDKNGRITFRFEPAEAIEDQVTSDRLNAMIDAINANKINKVVGGKAPSFLRTTTGTTIRVGGGRGADAVERQQKPKPWDIIPAPSMTANMLTITLIPGTFSGVVSSNYEDTIDIADSGTFYVVLNVTAVNGVVSSTEWAIDSSEPPPQSATPDVPVTTFKHLLGIIKDGVESKLVSEDVFEAQPVEVFREALPSPATNQLPYKPFYKWFITQ